MKHPVHLSHLHTPQMTRKRAIMGIIATYSIVTAIMTAYDYFQLDWF